MREGRLQHGASPRLPAAPVAGPGPRGLTGLARGGAALVALVALGLSGCGLSFTKAPDNQAVMAKLRERYAAKPRKFDPDPNKRLPYSIAVAPIRYALDKEAAHPDRDLIDEAAVGGGASPEAGAGTAEGGAEAGSGAEGAGDGGSSGGEGSGGGSSAPDGGDETGYRAPAGFGEELALRYRQPLYRQLLFAPIDPELAGKAPLVARRARPAQGDEGVTYVCARCLNDVGRADDRCPFCGLAFMPEPISPPGTPTPVVPPEPTPTPPEPTPTPVEPTPPTPPEPAPPEPTPPGPEPAPPEPAPPVVGGPGTQPPPVAPQPERFVCYFCKSEIDQYDTVCPVCQVAFSTEVQVPRPGQLWGGREGEFFFPPDVKSYAVYAPNADELQEELVKALQDYHAVGRDEDAERGVHAMKETELVDDFEALLEIAWNDNHTLLLRPTLKRCDVRFRDYSAGRLAGSIALWVLAWVPSWWVQAEEYEVTIEMDLELFHARTAQPIPRWKKTYRGVHREFVSPIDRGGWLLGYDVITVPATGGQGSWFGLTQGARRTLMENMYQSALADLKEKLLDQAYLAFVRDPIRPPEVKQSRNVGVLVASSGPQGVARLEHAIDDVNLMEETLRDVSQFKAADGGGRRTAGEVVRFDEDQPRDDVTLNERERRQPTYANVKRWLDNELPKLEAVDNLVLYFTGYGAAKKVDDESKLWGDGYEKYLCFDDTRPANLAGTALSMTELKLYLDNAKCKNVLVILDASFARQPEEGVLDDASGKTLPGIEITDQITGEFLQALSKRGGSKRCVVLSASAITDPAYESGSLAGGQGASVLTDAVVNGIRGEADNASEKPDGAVRVAELVTYVQDTCRQTGAYVLGLPIEVQVEGNARSVGIPLKPRVRATN